MQNKKFLFSIFFKMIFFPISLFCCNDFVILPDEVTKPFKIELRLVDLNHLSFSDCEKYKIFLNNSYIQRKMLGNTYDINLQIILLCNSNSVFNQYKNDFLESSYNWFIEKKEKKQGAAFIGILSIAEIWPHHKGDPLEQALSVRLGKEKIYEIIGGLMPEYKNQQNDKYLAEKIISEFQNNPDLKDQYFVIPNDHKILPIADLLNQITYEYLGEFERSILWPFESKKEYYLVSRNKKS